MSFNQIIVPSWKQSNSKQLAIKSFLSVEPLLNKVASAVHETITP
jgi:hypothetical protein